VHRREADGEGGEISVTDVAVAERSRENCYSVSLQLQGWARMPKTLTRQTFSNVSDVVNESFIAKHTTLH
jgi:hypothetical protein